jgi:hypothetical protein
MKLTLGATLCIAAFVLGVLVSAPAQTMGPTFKKKAWRALDALGRIDPGLNRDSNDGDQKEKVLDAQKAVDDAKYEVSNEVEQDVLRSLQNSILARADMANWEVGVRPWLVDSNLAFQCEVEVRVLITPEELSEAGKQAAARKTCNKSERGEVKK